MRGAGSRWRVIFSIVAQIFRLQDLTYRQVQDQHCSTDIQAARSDLQASARRRVIFSIVAQISRLQELTYRQVQDGE